MTVEFESELYQFSEGEREAEVCVVLIGSIQGTVSVQILIDNTAEQGNNSANYMHDIVFVMHGLFFAWYMYTLCRFYTGSCCSGI